MTAFLRNCILDLKNLLRNSLSRTFHVIRAHKKLFIFLIFFQLFSLVLLFSHAFQAQLAMGKDLQQLGLQIQQANYNPEELKAGKPFVQDPLQVFQLYRSLKRNFLLFAVQFSGIFLVCQGILWLGTHRFFWDSGNSGNFGSKEYGKQILKYLTVMFFFYGLFFSAFYLIIKSQLASMDAEVLGATLQYFGYVFLLVYYLLTTALVFLGIPAWKNFFSQWFGLAVKKYYLCLPISIFSLLPAAAFFYGIFYAVQVKSSFPLMLFFTIGFVFCLVFGRIFFIAIIQELTHEKWGN